jgi:putative ABC transport system substrate-binding protein
MRRREFVAALGIAAASPVVARAQQPAMPVVGVLKDVDWTPQERSAFAQGLAETGT